MAKRKIDESRFQTRMLLACAVAAGALFLLASITTTAWAQIRKGGHGGGGNTKGVMLTLYPAPGNSSANARVIIYDKKGTGLTCVPILATAGAGVGELCGSGEGWTSFSYTISCTEDNHGSSSVSGTSAIPANISCGTGTWLSVWDK